MSLFKQTLSNKTSATTTPTPVLVTTPIPVPVTTYPSGYKQMYVNLRNIMAGTFEQL